MSKTDLHDAEVALREATRKYRNLALYYKIKDSTDATIKICIKGGDVTVQCESESATIVGPAGDIVLRIMDHLLK